MKLTVATNAAASRHLMIPGLNAPPSFEEERIPRLLLVDDEPRLLSSLADLLSDSNCLLVTATCGREAIEQLSKLQFDLVLLDLRMPDMSGHDIMDFINAHGIEADVIILSGDTGIDAAIGALKRGAFGYLRKPYQHEELLNTVRNALQRRHLAEENRQMSWRLECSERMHRYLVDSSPDIIYILNSEGRLTFINERAQQLLGLIRDELVGEHYSKMIHEEDVSKAMSAFDEHRIGERALHNIELRLKCSGGDEKARMFEHTLITVPLNVDGARAHGKGGYRKEHFGVYGVARDITQRKQAEELASYQAYHDILTGLPNRALFRDRLDLALIQAKRNGNPLAVMFIDLDRFKLVNDSMGHTKGDELLRQVAGRLKQSIRGSDTLARVGGDEFVLLLPSYRERKDVSAIADKILECLNRPFHLNGHELHISASVGIAIYPEDGNTLDDLVRHADIAMYHVKSLGKNGHSFYDQSMLDASNQKITLEHDLRKALEQGELELYYQPQVDVTSGCIVGAEALMRWNHPEQGLLSAGAFLPFAEENGLMMPISDWMIEAACRDLREWNNAGCQLRRLSLNLSPMYLDRGNFVRKLQDAMIRHDISPTQLEVEITENICIRNPKYAIEQLNQLCQLGVSVAIDDFGTGYSSLAYLHRFPIHTLKIDQSFVQEIQPDVQHFPVVMALISISQGLGLNLIAEGVETESQARYLEQAGCTTLQGFLFHRPLSRSQFFQKLRDGKAALPN